MTSSYLKNFKTELVKLKFEVNAQKGIITLTLLQRNEWSYLASVPTGKWVSEDATNGIAH